MWAVPRPFHRSPQRRQREPLFLKEDQPPVGNPPRGRPGSLLLPGIAGLWFHRGAITIPVFPAERSARTVIVGRWAAFKAALPPGWRQKLPALDAARPRVLVSVVRGLTPFGENGGQRRSRTCSLPLCCGRASSCASCPYWRGLIFPGTPSGSRHRSHYMTRRKGDSNPTMPPGGCLISPAPAPTPSGRGVFVGAAGLSRLSSVTDLPLCHRYHLAEGAPLPVCRARLLAGCSTHRHAAGPRGFIPGTKPGGHGSGIPPGAAPFSAV